MDQARMADIIEIEQLLARYAVGMTKDDIETVMEVFTPDGTYRRTERGWRLATRSMTFLRRCGARDAGRVHDPGRPEPSVA